MGYWEESAEAWRRMLQLLLPQLDRWAKELHLDAGDGHAAAPLAALTKLEECSDSSGINVQSSLNWTSLIGHARDSLERFAEKYVEVNDAYRDHFGPIPAPDKFLGQFLELASIGAELRPSLARAAQAAMDIVDHTTSPDLAKSATDAYNALNSAVAKLDVETHSTMETWVSELQNDIRAGSGRLESDSDSDSTPPSDQADDEQADDEASTLVKPLTEKVADLTKLDGYVRTRFGEIILQKIPAAEEMKEELARPLAAQTVTQLYVFEDFLSKNWKTHAELADVSAELKVLLASVARWWQQLARLAMTSINSPLSVQPATIPGSPSSSASRATHSHDSKWLAANFDHIAPIRALVESGAQSSTEAVDEIHELAGWLTSKGEDTCSPAITDTSEKLKTKIAEQSNKLERALQALHPLRPAPQPKRPPQRQGSPGTNPQASAGSQNPTQRKTTTSLRRPRIASKLPPKIISFGLGEWWADMEEHLGALRSLESRHERVVTMVMNSTQIRPPRRTTRFKHVEASATRLQAELQTLVVSHRNGVAASSDSAKTALRAFLRTTTDFYRELCNHIDTVHGKLQAEDTRPGKDSARARYSAALATETAESAKFVSVAIDATMPVANALDDDKAKAAIRQLAAKISDLGASTVIDPHASAANVSGTLPQSADAAGSSGQPEATPPVAFQLIQQFRTNCLLQNASLLSNPGQGSVHDYALLEFSSELSEPILVLGNSNYRDNWLNQYGALRQDERLDGSFAYSKIGTVEVKELHGHVKFENRVKRRPGQVTFYGVPRGEARAIIKEQMKGKLENRQLKFESKPLIRPTTMEMPGSGSVRTRMTRNIVNASPISLGTYRDRKKKVRKSTFVQNGPGGATKSS